MTRVEEPRLLAGRYELGELIGRGGMAEVHAGYDTRLGREVAIKLLRADLARDPSFLMRFRREAQAAAVLTHPCIVAVFDSGEDEIIESGGATLAVPFIVMERVHGRTLREVLVEEGPLTPRRASLVMADVIEALGFSHQVGIVHRDVKPANVMLDDQGGVKVMDFGIARAIADTAATVTNAAVVIGTAQYLSPEQAQGKDIDQRSDLYAAGCVLFELLTGRAPFIGDSPVAVAYQHVGEPAPPPSRFAAGVPADLDIVVAQSLAKSPAKRYQDAESFAADLRAVAGGRPITGAVAARVPGGRRGASSTATGPTGPTTGPAAGPTSGSGDDALATDRDGPDTDEVPSIPTSDPTTGPMPVIVPGPRRVPLGWLALVLVLVISLTAAAFWAVGVLGAPRDVPVPSVVGLTESAARSEVTRLGFAAATLVVNDRSTPGTVVDQDPKASSQQSPGSTVTLKISGGPRTVTVPDLSNYDQASAREILQSAGLQIGTVRLADSFLVPVGNVVATDPKAGSKIQEGMTVGLIVSNGKAKVPDVTGLTESAARAMLNAVGFTPAVTYISSSQRMGTVVAQGYKAGTTVSVGTPIPLQIVKYRPRTVTRTTTVTPSSGSSQTGTTGPTTPVTSTGTPKP